MPREPKDSLDVDVTGVDDVSQQETDSVSLGDQPTAGDAGLSLTDLSGDDESFEEMGEVIDLSTRYEIQGELGAGGMGQVLKAADRRLKRTVAIKRLKAEISRSRTALRRFLTEAQAIAALNHYHIVQVHDYGRDSEGPFLILEYVDGTNLAERLQQGPMDVSQAVEITCQLCDALSLAHQKGIIHRDIKPANVLLTIDESPKLTDFGLARQEDTDTSQTQAGVVLGTLDYMPPEQRRDATATDARSDLWSLGATLYQMLSGETPRVINLDAVPTPLRDIVATALKSAPGERYATAVEFAEALRGVERSLNQAERTLGEGECRECGVTNDMARKFCRDCGSGLREPCLHCATDIGMWEKFCPECGTNLVELEQTHVDQINEQRQRIEVLRSGDRHRDALAALDQLVEANSHTRIVPHLAWVENFRQAITAEKQKREERTAQLLADAEQHVEDRHESKALACLEQISEASHTDASRALRDSVRQRLTEIETLRTEIQRRLKSKEYTGLLARADRYLELRPNSKQLKRIRSKLQGWEDRQRSRNPKGKTKLPPIANATAAETPKRVRRVWLLATVGAVALGAFVVVVLNGGSAADSDSISVNDAGSTGDSSIGTVALLSEDAESPEDNDPTPKRDEDAGSVSNPSERAGDDINSSPSRSVRVPPLRTGEIDLLERIGRNRQGDGWRTEAGVLIFTPTSTMGVPVTIGAAPSGAYELKMVVQRDSDATGGIVIPVVWPETQSWVYLAGGWVGSNSAIGMGIEHGDDMMPTLDPYTITCRVDSSGLKIDNGGNGVMNWSGAPHRLSKRSDNKPMVLRSYMNCRIHALRLRPLAAPPAGLAATKSPSSLRLVQTYHEHNGYVPCVAASPDGERFASAGVDKTVRLWTPGWNTAIWKSEMLNEDPVALAFSEDGNRIWVADTQTIYRLDTADGKVSKQMPIPRLNGQAPDVGCFGLGCSRYIAAGHGQATILDTYRRTQGPVIKEWVPCVAMTLQGDHILAGSFEKSSGAVSLCRSSNADVILRYEGLRDRTACVTVSNDDQFIAAASGVAAPDNKPEENRIMVWNRYAADVLFSKRAGSCWQRALAFTPDSRYLISGGGSSDPDWSGHRKDADCNIRVWDFKGDRLVLNLDGHTAAVQSLAVLSGEKLLVSSGCDETVRLWRLPE